MFGANKSQKVLEKQKHSHREWLKGEASSEMKTTDLNCIEEDLESDAPGAWQNIADSLGRLGTWHAVTGLVVLTNGNTAGWSDVHRAWLYKVTALRIRISTFQKGRVLGRFRPVESLELEASPSALCLAYAMMFAREFETTLFEETLRVMTIDKSVVPDAYWRYHSLEPFMVRLFAMSQRREPPPSEHSGPALGCYQAIFDSWNQPNELAEAIHSACEFHCQRIGDKSEKFAAEFRNPPFDLIPAEILAIYSVRQALGLHTPRIDHPLLKPPFNTPIGSPSEIQDDLLDMVEAKL